AQVKGHPILLMLDSGSSGCIVSANFLKDKDISIDRSSTVVMIGVHGEQKCPLGKIDKFLITVGDKIITLRAIITDAGNYTDKNIDKYCKPANINKRIKKKRNSATSDKSIEEEKYTSEEETESEKDKSNENKEY
ncbi:14188_t:CDS:2, partial [Dentiscutata heterogama]